MVTLLVLLIFAAIVFTLMALDRALRNRNKLVYKVRMDLLKKIEVAAFSDIMNDTPCQWRFDAFNSVSYKEMVYKFWRKPTALYNNLDFINPEVRKPWSKP